MADRTQSGEELLAEMVAYLDGELSPADSLRVEQRLAADDDYRRRLQRLEQAWHALDELPLTMVDDRFARTTMTMVVAGASQDVAAKTRALPAQARRRRWSRLLAGAALAALGFLAVRLAVSQPNQQLRTLLPVVDNVDLYSQLGDVEFLARLHKQLPPELAADANAAGDVDARLERFRRVVEPDSRDEFLRDLSDDEAAALRAKANRYRNLSADQQRRLRDLHDAVVAAPDSAALQRTMFLYQQWLDGLPPARRFELRDQPVDQRVETVARWAAELHDDALLSLSEEELRRLFDELRQPLAALRAGASRPGDRPGARSGRGSAAGPPLGAMRKQINDRLAASFDQRQEFYDALLAALPARTRGPFEELGRRQQIEQFFAWMRQHAALAGEVSQQELERFFAEELDVETRTELLKLPPEQMQQALRRHYQRDPNSPHRDVWRGLDRGRGPWRGPWPNGPRRGPNHPPGGPGNGPPPPGEGGPPPDFRPPPEGFDGPRPRDFGPPDPGPPPDAGLPRPFGPPPERE